MQSIIEKLTDLAVIAVLGLVLAHPQSWRAELAKLQYSILKEVGRTDNWGEPRYWVHQSRKK